MTNLTMASRNVAQQTSTKGRSALLKVVLLGNGGVGKSCLMNRYVHGTFDNDSYHTIGVEFLDKTIEFEGKQYCLQIWDTAGQERFKSLRTPFYRGSDICILTYSISDLNSYQALTMWRKEFLHYAGVDEEDFPFIIFANKCDITPEVREVHTGEAQAWCEENGYPFIETSAKDAINVEQAFHLALQNWMKNEAKLGKPCIAPTVDLNSVKTKKTCC